MLGNFCLLLAEVELLLLAKFELCVSPEFFDNAALYTGGERLDEALDPLSR